ncbi:MAG: hypothetical protein ACK4GQ_04955 [Candidatus Hadarchaeales archaeon]
MNMLERPVEELVALVREHRLDPWDVDISKLITVYSQKMEEWRDIRVFAKILYFTAFLLRMKSEAALNGNGKNIREDVDELLEMLDELPDLGEITLLRLAPRRIALPDLLGFLKEALEEIPLEKQVEIKPEIRAWGREDFKAIEDSDITLEEKIPLVYNRIREALKSSGLLTLMDLVPVKTREEILWVFISLLFLCTDGKIRMQQDEPFGEIKIMLPGGSDGNR